MSEVQRYCAEKSDLEICWEGSKPEPDDLVMYADFDRVTAERDALRVALEQSGDLKNDLQQRLTAADERADVLYGLLREVVALDPRGEFLGWQLDGKIDAALKPAEAPRNQCDGCQAGIPVVSGSHRMGKPGGYPDMMGCTAKLYKP